MKDHLTMFHVTKFDSLRLNRDQVMDLETWFKIFSLKPCKTLKSVISFVTTVKTRHVNAI